MNIADMTNPFGSSGATSAQIDAVKGLHQYYRDCLSTPVDFPETGDYPPELIKWVVDRRNTDVGQLAEFLEAIPRTSLSAEHDLALRVTLFTILQANLASDYNNRFPNYTLPAGIIGNIKKNLGRILELHPCSHYIAICVQLLYRIKEVDEVLVLSESYPDIFARYPILQAIVGFIHTSLGNYRHALTHLQPLASHAEHRNIPLVGLSLMTCQHRLGMTPDWPLAFDSIATDTGNLQELIGQLSKMEMLQPLENPSRPVVFVACDTKYFFEHAVFLAYSMHETNVGQLDLHLHLYSPASNVLAAIEQLRQRLPGLSIGISAEYDSRPLPNAPAYYATARFVRAYQVLQHYQCELCMMDADALFNGSWERFKNMLPKQTELVLACPTYTPFWEQVLAGFIYCRPTPFVEHFLAKVAQFILWNLRQERVMWFTDQIALSVCDDVLATGNPAVHHIDSRAVIDLQHTPDSLCWMVTTVKTGNLSYDAARERLARRYD